MMDCGPFSLLECVSCCRTFQESVGFSTPHNLLTQVSLQLPQGGILSNMKISRMLTLENIGRSWPCSVLLSLCRSAF